jgi:hypothetical protein
LPNSEGIARCIHQSAALDPGTYSVLDSAGSAADGGTWAEARIDNTQAEIIFAQLIRRHTHPARFASTLAREVTDGR